MSSSYALIAFNLFVLGLLALDLRVFHRRPHALGFREAALWSALWVGLSLVSNLGLYFWRGSQPALEFLTGYILEKSFSLDNVFVFVVIFNYAGVSTEYQHRVLSWGILGALGMRGALIAAGSALVSHFHWILYIFAAFLLVTGARLLFGERRAIDPERNPVLRLARLAFPITKNYDGSSFFIRRDGKLLATPLFLVLLMVETADIVFALDSIPAIFAVTREPFIIYTSNVLAVLGLRAMYSLVAEAVPRFHHLRRGISLILMFAGTKMLIAPFYKVPLWTALGVIGGILAITTLVSANCARNRNQTLEKS